MFVLLFFLILTSYCRSSSETEPGIISDKEREAISKLKTIISPDELYRDYMKSDYYLLRWVQDSDLDVERAATKLRNTIKWRKENNIDSILQEDFSDVRKYCPYENIGKDKTGSPVGIIYIGSCNIRKLVLKGKSELVTRFVYSFNEYGANSIRDALRNGTGDTKLVSIIDFSGFNIREQACLSCLPIFRLIISVGENHYPGIAKAVYIINFPRLAAQLSQLVLPVASPKLQSILHFYGYNEDEWKRELLKLVDPDQLPQKLGGNKRSSISNQA